MKWFGSINLQVVSVLLHVVTPNGICAFIPYKISPRIGKENGKCRRSSNSMSLEETVESSEPSFEAPSPRWSCPPHEDVCTESGVTLSRYMKEMVRANPELDEIESST